MALLALYKNISCYTVNSYLWQKNQRLPFRLVDRPSLSKDAVYQLISFVYLSTLKYSFNYNVMDWKFYYMTLNFKTLLIRL